MKLSLVVLVVLVGIFSPINCLDNGLATTPPMGWIHWGRYGCTTDCKKYPEECINEDLFKRIADTLVYEGYACAGYEYVIIDDCWQEKERDHKTNRLVPDRERFPSGLKALADYIHEMGLKFGIFENVGTRSYNGYPGGSDHMQLDAQTFAEWGIDYVKLDGSNVDIKLFNESFSAFGKFLNETGRPMVYSCSWPVYEEMLGILPNYEIVKKTCNLWPIHLSIEDSYQSLTTTMDFFSKNQDRIQPHGGPGHWNDPFTLILGNFGLSYDQSKTQMAVWAILAAPLIMSNNLEDVQPEIRDILQNEDIISVNQDPLGIQGRRVFLADNIEVWARPITPTNAAGEHSYAVAFVSRRSRGVPYEMKFLLKEIPLENTEGYKVQDLFSGEMLGETYHKKDSFETRINPSGVNFFKFIAV